MKRLITILCCAVAAMVLMTSPGKGDLSDLGDKIKRRACEKACDRAYEACMKGSGKALDTENQGEIESDVKEIAKEESCQYAKDQCLQNCD
jgi:hypothetical protein